VTDRQGATTDRQRDQQAGASALLLELRRDVHAPRAARAAIEGWRPPGLAAAAPRRETLLLLVSELVTNAVVHSPAAPDAPIQVAAHVVEDRVSVAVTDAGEGFTPPRRVLPPSPRRLVEGGYGLYLVNRTASRWGIDREGGTRVWFEL
jgi:anti-sigma regulatory factor (Ser/Thr protein kinase)